MTSTAESNVIPCTCGIACLYLQDEGRCYAGTEFKASACSCPSHKSNMKGAEDTRNEEGRRRRTTAGGTYIRK
jgi:hypothetical protein